MKHTFKEENGHLIATVNFDQEEVKTATGKATRKLIQNVTVPGFRKGKAPEDKAARYIKNEDLFNGTIDALLRMLDKNFESNEEFSAYVKGNKFAPRLHPDVALDKFTDTEAQVTVTYYLRPAVSKLGQYKDLKSDIEETKVDEEAINAELNRLALENAELVPTEKAAEMGDTVNIDFQGLMDGVPFDGGTAKAFDLELGSNKFVPGFEEQCVGHKPGEKFDVNIIMPDTYPAPLTSKPALFKVTLNAVKVKEVPEINDDFATTLSGQYVSKDLAELKEKVEHALMHRFFDAYKRDKVNNYLNQIKNSSEYVIPTEYVKTLVDDRVKQDQNAIEQQGLSLEEYLKLIQQTREVYEDSIRAGVENELKTSLIYDAIAEAEKIPAPTQKDVEAQIGSPIAKFAENYTNYLKAQNYTPDQINNQINGYLNQVFTSILTARVQAKVLELNDPELAARKLHDHEEVKEEEAPAEEAAAEEAAPVEEAKEEKAE